MTPASLLAEPETIAVDLYGYGRVAKALLPRLHENGIPVASIRDSKGVRAAAGVVRGRRVLVDATAPRYAGPEADRWLATVEEALASGTPVVTCNKAPLAIAWDRLVAAAQRGGTVLACSATVGGGTPVLHLLRRVQASHGLHRIEATLSGTLGFVLDRLARGAPLAAAVREAQRAGYAEPDPALDLDGTDAYAKAVILHNRFFPGAAALALGDRGRPFELREEVVRAIVRSGLEPHAVATIEPGRIDFGLEGRPAGEFLAGAPAHVVVRAVGRDGSVVVLTGPGAGPAVTAGALLGDLVAVRERPDGGGGPVLP